MAAKITAHRLIVNRKRFGLTQRGAAKLLGVTPTQLMQWEKGQKLPKGKNLFKIVALYKALIEDIYYELRHQAIAEVEANRLKYGPFGTDKPP